MSIATDKLKEEAKETLCNLLRIPNDRNCKDVDKFIDKILLCATIEVMALIKQQISIHKENERLN